MGMKFNPITGFFDLVGGGTGGGSTTPVGPVTLNNNATNATAITIAATNVKIKIEYSITRNGETRDGNFDVASNGTIVSLADGGYAETAEIGLTWSAVISGANVLIRYSTTNTGFTGSLKYILTSWS